MKHVLNLCLLMTGCQVREYAYYEEQWPEVTVKIWIQEHPDIDPGDVQAGCTAWHPEGVVCVREKSPDLADIRYHFVEEGCGTLQLVNRDGQTFDAVLGASDPSGDVEFHLDCFPHYPHISSSDLRAVAAHETGHQFGLSHVWRDCSTPSLDPGDLDDMCGYAVMNSGFKPMLEEMTVVDHRAFCLGEDVLSAVPFPDRMERW